MNSHCYTTWEGGQPIGPSPQEYISGGSCVICGEPFPGMHKRSKTTCSPACRKALSRLKGRIDSGFLRGMEIIELLAGAQQIEDLSADATSALKSLKEAIEEALDD